MDTAHLWDDFKISNSVLPRRVGGCDEVDVLGRYRDMLSVAYAWKAAVEAVTLGEYNASNRRPPPKYLSENRQI